MCVCTCACVCVRVHVCVCVHMYIPAKQPSSNPPKNHPRLAEARAACYNLTTKIAGHTDSVEGLVHESVGDVFYDFGAPQADLAGLCGFCGWMRKC